MIFVRIELDDGSEHEWGVRLKVVPQIGDTLWLSYELPGEVRTGNWHLEAVVTQRLFAIFDDNAEQDQEVVLTAKSSESVPDGFIADSPEWPSDDMDSFTVKKALMLKAAAK